MRRWAPRTIAYLLLLGVFVFDQAQLHATVDRVRRDEQATRRAQVYTRAVQVKGQPISVCLLDVMREVAPLLERVPTVERPLQAYVRLQDTRYPGVLCPDGP